MDTRLLKVFSLPVDGVEEYSENASYSTALPVRDRHLLCIELIFHIHEIIFRFS